MDKALLDTDIFSEILKGRDQIVAAQVNSYRLQFGQFTISAVTVAEIVKGWHKRGLEKKIAALLAGLATEVVLPVGLDEAVMAGRIFAELDKVGDPIGRADPFIAGTALVHDLTLVTGNTKHFERITALGFPLRLANWRMP